MKTEFHEFYTPTEAEIKALWEDCIFAFDASVLLNLYFYSQKTANTYLSIVKLLRDRVWLPFQAGLEYQRNRRGVLSKVINGHEDVRKTLLHLLSSLKAKNLPPFFSEELSARFEKLGQEMTTEIDEAIARIKDCGDDDPIRSDLDDTFKGKVGPELPEKRLRQIYSDGKDRYRNCIPPGYKDEKEKQGNAIFGDLVIWNEMIEKAKGEKKPLIFVTDDAKEDWWHILNKKTIGPRPELQREFQQESGHAYFSYKSQDFLWYSDKFLSANIAKEAIDEIADASRRDRLLTFELGYEDLELVTDEEIQAAQEALENVDPDSEEYFKAYRQYRELADRKSAEHYSTAFLPSLSAGASAKRSMLVAEIQGLLEVCRSKPTWNSRSEYKLPSWLEHVPEEMIPYTSMPNLLRIRENLTEFLRRHTETPL